MVENNQWVNMRILLCSLALFIVAAWADTPEQLVPQLGGPQVMQCQRLPVTGALDCVPVRFLPSVRFSRTSNILTVSGPDPSRSLWVQAHGINAGDYAGDVAAAPAVEGMPPNYFCVDLTPALSGSGAALLLFDARVRLEADSSSIRVSGALSSGPKLIPQLSAAVPWPGTYPGTAPPPGTVHVYPIGPGCRNFPAISFEPMPSGDGSSFIFEDVFVFVSIP
jgi:hypothetical protein